MGIYTPILKLYKPEPTEFVDVDVQMNPNWKNLDTMIKRTLEYEYVDPKVATPDISNTLDRDRFYKPWSNSVIAYLKNTKTWYQDPGAHVSAWVPALQFFVEGVYAFAPDGHSPAYRIIKSMDGSKNICEWTGAFWSNGATLPLNVNTAAINAGNLPSEARPIGSVKYFDVYAGSTTTNYSVARIIVQPTGLMEFKRYGTNPAAGGAENRISLDGIEYEVA